MLYDTLFQKGYEENAGFVRKHDESLSRARSLHHYGATLVYTSTV